MIVAWRAASCACCEASAWFVSVGLARLKGGGRTKPMAIATATRAAATATRRGEPVRRHRPPRPARTLPRPRGLAGLRPGHGDGGIQGRQRLGRMPLGMIALLGVGGVIEGAGTAIRVNVPDRLECHPVADAQHLQLVGRPVRGRDARASPGPHVRRGDQRGDAPRHQDQQEELHEIRHRAPRPRRGSAGARRPDRPAPARHRPGPQRGDRRGARRPAPPHPGRSG